MTTYKIIPGIAALVTVECDLFPDNFGFKRSNFIYMSDEKLPEKGCGYPVKWEDLPLKVQAEINKHFGIVFSLPIEKRDGYLKQLVAWEVEA